MDKAFIGLIGVALGFLLTTLKDWLLQKKKNRKEIEYLSVKLISLLDKFTSGCADVVFDNGVEDKDGHTRAQTNVPSFQPDEIVGADWRSLPTNLLFEVLNFPSEIESSNRAITGAFEFVATPPDYSDGFEERQYHYAKLGIKANELATKLRKYSHFPQREIEDWDNIKYMQEHLIRIDDLRQQRALEHSKSFLFSQQTE